MNHRLGRQRGVSLIEALVAFGVMAFGMMAVVGMQTTLRSSGDLARQRAEAVRIAQDYIEEWRGFSTLVTTANRTAYADIATAADTDIVGANATYTLKRRVPPNDVVAGTVTPQRHTVVVNVEWLDRTGQLQRVQLSTTVAGIEPELAASLVLQANPDAVLSPLGRYRGIPVGAVPLPNGRSGYIPPGQTGEGPRIAWVFNNTTGIITLCTTTVTTSAALNDGNLDCGTDRALLVSGGVRFQTALEPTPANVADPAGPDYPLFGISVLQTAPFGGTVTCFQAALANTQVNYLCAVPITSSIPNWTGQVVFGAPLGLAPALADPSDTLYKVCRYFDDASYTAQATALLSRNFLIIKAGDGTVAYGCPTGGTPQATWVHQPLS